MKTISKGRKQKGWAKEFRCTGGGNQGGGCNAVLLVEQADLFSTESHARDETTYYVTFRCQECGTLTDINPNSWPVRPGKLLSKNAWFAENVGENVGDDDG